MSFQCNELTPPTKFLRQGLGPPIRTRKHICITSNLSKARAQPLALTFPDTSLFIKVVKRLERKIDERLRSSTSCIAVNGLGFNEMQLLASFAESVLPTHDRG